MACIFTCPTVWTLLNKKKTLLYLFRSVSSFNNIVSLRVFTDDTRTRKTQLVKTAQYIAMIDLAARRNLKPNKSKKNTGGSVPFADGNGQKITK
jgi:hypothetical protein